MRRPEQDLLGCSCEIKILVTLYKTENEKVSAGIWTLFFSRTNNMKAKQLNTPNIIADTEIGVLYKLKLPDPFSIVKEP